MSTAAAADKIIVLAFDVEDSGHQDSTQTGVLAIGGYAKAYGGTYSSQIGLNMYLPGKHKFEARCKEEFWDKHPEVLKAIVADDQEQSIEEVEKASIETFVAWVASVEERARTDGATLYRVTDNAKYDPERINALIDRHLPSDHPKLPYTFTKDPVSGKHEYASLYETHSMQKGFLMTSGILDADWGLTQKIRELYGLEEPDIKHDHLPWHDAQTIAEEFFDLLRVAEKRKKASEELYDGTAVITFDEEMEAVLNRVEVLDPPSLAKRRKREAEEALAKEDEDFLSCPSLTEDEGDPAREEWEYNMQLEAKAWQKEEEERQRKQSIKDYNEQVREHKKRKAARAKAKTTE